MKHGVKRGSSQDRYYYDDFVRDTLIDRKVDTSRIPGDKSFFDLGTLKAHDIPQLDNVERDIIKYLFPGISRQRGESYRVALKGNYVNYGLTISSERRYILRYKTVNDDLVTFTPTRGRKADKTAKRHRAGLRAGAHLVFPQRQVIRTHFAVSNLLKSTYRLIAYVGLAYSRNSSFVDNAVIHRVTRQVHLVSSLLAKYEGTDRVISTSHKEARSLNATWFFMKRNLIF